MRQLVRAAAGPYDPWMNYLRHGLLPLLALTGLACGGGGAQTSSASTSSGLGGAETSSSSASAGTGGGATTSSSAASSGGTGGQGGGGPCVGTIDLAIDGIGPQHFTFECAGDFDANQWGAPVGYLFAGNLPGQPHGMRIVGCRTAAADSEGLVLEAYDAAGIGPYTTGRPKYTDPGGVVFGTGNDPFNMSVTYFGAGGQPIDGSFSVTSTNGTASHDLAGTFHVCHGADFLPP